MNEKILITGGSGFVGQNVIRALLKQKPSAELYNLSRTPLAMDGIINITCSDATIFDLKNISEQFDYIIHTLALSNEAYCGNFDYAQEVNIAFTKKLLAFSLQQKNLKKFVYISSIILYDNTNLSPVTEDGKLYLHHSNYGFTKGVAEYYVSHFHKKLGLPVIIFRLSNIYGPYQNFHNSPFLVPSKIVQALTNNRIEVLNLTPRRDWIYSEDAGKAIAQSLHVDYNGILNLANGTPVSVKEIIDIIATQLNVGYTSLEKPVTGPLDFYCDISKIKKELNWKPETNLHCGIVHTIDYISSHLNES